jgi:hypothetical protein
MVFPPPGIAKRVVETERWLRFFGRSARNDLMVVSTTRFVIPDGGHRTERAS